MLHARIEITNARVEITGTHMVHVAHTITQRGPQGARANQESLISVRKKERIAGEGSNKSAKKEPYGHLRIPRRRHHRSIYISTRRGHISERRPIYLFYPLVRGTGQRRSGD